MLDVNDSRISRIHCIINYAKGQYTLTCKSANACTLNDTVLTATEEPVVLRDGDRIGIGSKA